MCNRANSCLLQYWKALRCYCHEQGIGLCMAYKVAGDGEAIPFLHPTLINSLHNASLIISGLFFLKTNLLNQVNFLGCSQHWDCNSAFCVGLK